MTIQNETELENTRKKLRVLEEGYEEARQDPKRNDDLRDAEMESLRRLINQMKEEIARYQARQPAGRSPF